MTAQLTVKQLKEIGEQQSSCCLSLYFPTGIRGKESDKRRVEIKNMINDLLKKDDNELMAPCRKRLKAFHPGEEALGTFGSGTKIYFISPDYEFNIEVPAILEPSAKLSEKFFILPLLELWHYEKPHYFLKLALNQVELFQVTGLRMEKIEFQIPENLQEYYSPEMEAWSLKKFNKIRDTYYQSNKPDLMQQGSDRFFGISKLDKHDIREAELGYFLRHIDICLMETLGDKSIPLFLAADEHIARQFMSISQYPKIQGDFIRGNPEALSDRELHHSVAELVKQKVDQGLVSTLKEFQDLRRTAQAIDDLKKLQLAAESGVIKTLMLSKDVSKVAGNLSQPANKQERKRIELLNHIASQTLTHGGQILWFKHGVLPTKSPAAAVLHTAI